MTTIADQIVEQINRLTEDQQRRVLEFARQLELPEGIPGKALIAWAQHNRIPPEDLVTMQRAIEEGCERIDDDWNKPIFPA